MTIQDVKQIKLADYLQSLGYTPVKQQGRNLWYKSPLREETDASFKVNTELEKWYDFGIGKGGNIIALAAELYRSEDVAYLLKRIEERTAYIRPASFSFGRQHSNNQPYQGLRVGELSSLALIAYLQERGINIGLAKRECRELRFMNADKPYFAIGFPNMAGGYEVRNRYFKGCVAPKDITHIRQAGRTTMYVLPVRGVHGLPLIPYHPSKKQSATPAIGHTGLCHTELRFQSCESGKLIGNLHQNRLFP